MQADTTSLYSSCVDANFSNIRIHCNHTHKFHEACTDVGVEDRSGFRTFDIKFRGAWCEITVRLRLIRQWRLIRDMLWIVTIFNRSLSFALAKLRRFASLGKSAQGRSVRSKGFVPPFGTKVFVSLFLQFLCSVQTYLRFSQISAEGRE